MTDYLVYRRLHPYRVVGRRLLVETPTGDVALEGIVPRLLLLHGDGRWNHRMIAARAGIRRIRLIIWLRQSDQRRVRATGPKSGWRRADAALPLGFPAGYRDPYLGQRVTAVRATLQRLEARGLIALVPPP